MSKIKELKTNTNHIVNLVDVVELFVPDKRSKYTDLILRIMARTENIEEYASEVKDSLCKTYDFLDKKELDRFGPIQLILIYKFIDNYFHQEDLITFRKFCEFNERGLIQQNDLSQYKTFDEINEQVSLGELKVSSKQLEKEITKVFDNDEWLLIRPLTYFASRKYGSNTKWCTTSADTPDYFRKYSKRGVLIYCINKITGYKVASFYSLDVSDPEFSFWNQQDVRVDSLDTELNDELRLIIRNVCKDPFAKSNRDLLSKEQQKNEDEVINKRGSRNILMGEPIPVPPTEDRFEQELLMETTEPSRRARRIANALTRRNTPIVEELEREIMEEECDSPENE